jgi:mannose-6-phosphate isomerase
MIKIGLLKNTIQEYAWGSLTAIPELLGENNPAHKPQAELWMGAHPKAPSLVQYDGRWVSLLKLIKKNPQAILGNAVAKKFNNRLPYLFKVLAAAKPLSIQAHPDSSQAKAGFERENAQGIPIDVPHRNYRDENHKPECICALTPFWALSRFRKISSILSYMKTLCAKGLDNEIKELQKHQHSDGLKRFYTSLMTMNVDRKNHIVEEALKTAKRFEDQDPVLRWMLDLSKDYPHDIGVLSPVVLNLVCLEPGQALFLGAGELHAYLDGLGIELMANSDNVLRGGLTPKHVDVPELLRVLKFEDRDVTILKPTETHKHELVYASPADEFVLSAITLKRGVEYCSAAERSVEILICTQGAGSLKDLGSQMITDLKTGASAIVPAAVKSYSIKGEGRFYKAAVPRQG